MTTKTAITRGRIEAAFRAVDAGRHPTVTLRDPRMAGLALTVGRASARWTFSFKAPLPGGGWSGGKRLVLGDYSTMSIDAAREAAAAAKAQVADGLDPVAAGRARRTANVEAAASRSVAAAIERYSAERGADWTDDTRRAFAYDFRAIRVAIGDVPMAVVNRGRLAELVVGLIAPDGRKGVRQAKRVAGMLASLWRQAGPGSPRFAGWAWPGVDPAVADRLPVPGVHRLTARKRVLSEPEIRAVWPVLIADGTGQPARIVLALSLVTGARIGALALLEDADLDLDPLPTIGARDAGPTFRIVAAEGRKATAKDRREGGDLILPLSPLAVSLFRKALAIRSADEGPHVFETRTGRPLRASNATKIWVALAKRGLVPADTVAHDLRRSMRTGLGELDHGGSWEDEERLLGHKLGGAVAQTYDRGRRLKRLRPLADAWSARLEAIVGATPAQVVALLPVGRP